jgi:hypothetical protein
VTVKKSHPLNERREKTTTERNTSSRQRLDFPSKSLNHKPNQKLKARVEPSLETSFNTLPFPLLSFFTYQVIRVFPLLESS